MTQIQNTTPNTGEDAEEQECFFIASGNVKPLWKIA